MTVKEDTASIQILLIDPEKELSKI